MLRKAITVPIVIFIILFLFAGCPYFAYQDYYTIDDYSEIWQLAGFHHGYEGISDFFPNNIHVLDVQDFLCRYDQQLPLGEGIQLFLKVQYDETSFATEVNRLSSIGYNCNNNFENVEYSVYATRLGVESSSEYAIIDTAEQIIYYIYLQNLPKNEIEFPHEFLPDAYNEYGEVESK